MDFLSFRMKNGFFEDYKDRRPDFGFPMGAGNTLGEHAWITKYSRRKEDGSRERFWEGLRRVIEGEYSIQRDYALHNRLPWSDETAHVSAQEAYTLAFAGKWIPPGRSLWCMGTEIVNGRHDGSPLYNCSFISTAGIAEMEDPSLPFARLMDESMLGIGVGFDTLGAGKLALHQPSGRVPHQVADSREGWAESVAHLLRAFLLPGRRLPAFDYSRVRPAGALIKGFGGVASGPGPLMKVHGQLVTLLGNRAGEPITSSDIVDVNNLLGKCVVSANVRRSAEIALGLPDDEDFLELKNWKKNPVRNGRDGWSHLSNNSVIATTGSDLSHLASRIALNGEPGVYWLDVAQNYGRLADAPDHKEYRTTGQNPCTVGDTLLLTVTGLRKIGELAEAGTPFLLCNGNKEFTPSRAWQTGVKPVFKVTLVNGLEIMLTADHKIETVTRVSAKKKYDVPHETEVRDLKPGMAVMPCLGTGQWQGESPVSQTRATAYGILFGDGFRQASSGKSAYIMTREQEIIDFLSEEFGNDFAATSGDRYIIRGLLPELKKAGIILNPLPERDFPASVFAWSSDLMRAFLRGVFTANGGSMPKHGRVDLKGTNLAMLKDAQRALSALGYSAYITTNKPQVIKWRNGTYESRESYDLNISGVEQFGRFQAEIGFLHSHKSVPAENGEVTYRLPGVTKVRSVEYVGERPVYDFSEPREHWGWANGIKIHNCGEIPLESFEKCNLVETFPTRCGNLQDYLRVLKFAFLFSKSVTLLPVKWSESNEVMARNRRIGVSMSGVAQFAEKHGWAELRRWQDLGYKEIRRRDGEYSEWLGVRESIRVTTVKPSGTVSLLFGVTPGVHFPREGGYYVRTVREMRDSPFAKTMVDAGYPVEPSVSDPDTTVVITLPVEGPDIRSEREVSIWEKTALAALCQRWWSDNSVSVTVTFREDETGEIPAVFRAFDGQLKSLSMLPMAEDVYPQSPYQRVSREYWEELRANIRPIDWDSLYNSDKLPEAEGESYCANDSCEVPDPIGAFTDRMLEL